MTIDHVKEKIEKRVAKLNKYMESVGDEPHVVNEVKFLTNIIKTINDPGCLSKYGNLSKDIITVKQWIDTLQCFPDDYEVLGWRSVLISEHFDRKEDDGL